MKSNFVQRSPEPREGNLPYSTGDLSLELLTESAPHAEKQRLLAAPFELKMPAPAASIALAADDQIGLRRQSMIAKGRTAEYLFE